MTDTSKTTKTLRIVGAVLIVIAFALGVARLVSFSLGAIETASVILVLIALSCGAVYTAGGYKKNFALFYKIFMVLLAVSYAGTFADDLVSTLSPDGNGIFTGTVVFGIISAGAILLAVGKNLGKTVSMIVSCTLFAATAFLVIPPPFL